MDTVYRITRAVGHTLNSRLFAASALAVVSAAIIVFVSLNINAVTIVDGDTSRVVMTLDSNPHRVVENAGVALNEGDKVIAAGSNGVLTIDRAADVQITADGISTLVRMSEGTVADALEKVGVQIGENDKLNVPLDLNIDDGLDINVDRITYKVYTVTQTEKYTVDTDYTTTISHGSSFIKRAGVDGSKTITYRKTIKNGKVIKTETVKEVVNRKMVPQIKLAGMPKGTPQSVAPFKINLNSQGQPTNYKAKFTGRATAYSSDRGYAGTWTASGRRAEVGVVAVNPKKIPYGSKLYIVSPDGSYVYGYAVAGDTGRALMSGHCLVDLFFAHYEECLRFGARRLNVYVLE
ncbi:MAG: G5 domain-containing protein [Oscillospiraceae bacterium]|nr:G5 domain-containing protein [Oscillospiraceae bacterium]MDD4414205.1 G5 domain-containing protein [Oscillospiraceae bacterium]